MESLIKPLPIQRAKGKAALGCKRVGPRWGANAQQMETLRDAPREEGGAHAAQEKTYNASIRIQDKIFVLERHAW